MKCPRCVQRIHRAAESCPHCGFTLADADALFGTEGPSQRLIADEAGLLRRDGLRRIEQVVDRFGRRFPQLFLAIHTGSFGGAANLRQLGFWLLNRVVFEETGADKTNEAGILILIDAEEKVAGITFGYLLDPYMEEEDTFACLSRAHAYWLEGRYAEGLVRMIAQLELFLKKRSAQARRHPERFERRVAKPRQVEALAHRILHGRATSTDVEQEDQT